MALTFHEAGLDDAAALAALHVRVWRETYRDMAPPAAWTALDEARRLPQWQEHLTKGAPGGAMLARLDGAAIGLVSWSVTQDPVGGPRGEVRHLYVEVACRGRGIGQRLLVEALDRLHRAGCDSAVLAVVAKNYPARRFYAALGGVETGAFTDPGPLWRSDNVRVWWNLPHAA